MFSLPAKLKLQQMLRVRFVICELLVMKQMSLLAVTTVSVKGQGERCTATAFRWTLELEAGE